MTNQIIWTQLDDESADERIDRLNAELHRIFFDGKACSEGFTHENGEGCVTCSICDAVESQHTLSRHAAFP